MRQLLIVLLLIQMCLWNASYNIGGNSETLPQITAQQKLVAYAEKFNIPNLLPTLEKLTLLEDQEKVLAIVLSYYPKYLSSLEWKNEDVMFTIRGKEIWYKKGQMLDTANLNSTTNYRSIIYPYRIEALVDIFEDLPLPNKNFSRNYKRASDFQISLAGGKLSNIPKELNTYQVLSFPVTLHPLAGERAERASQQILQLAKSNKEIALFLEEIGTISGYAKRNVQNSSNLSMHAFGLAFDFIPHDYKGKVAYWLWAQKTHPQNWNTIPLAQRWMPPDTVVSIFQDHGFIWGGKWPHYDMLHFEYRPELIAYARVREHTGSKSSWQRTERSGLPPQTEQQNMDESTQN